MSETVGLSKLTDKFKLAVRATLRGWRSEFFSDPEEAALAALSTAYLTLLRMPHGGVRGRNQMCLATLRDAIAAELGDDEESVQNFYEYWSVHYGPPPRETQVDQHVNAGN